VSNLADGFVDKVSDIVKVGDEMTIEVIGEDKMGRPDLKRIDGDRAGSGEPSGGRSRDRGGRRREESHDERPAAPAIEVKEGDIIEGVVSNTTDYGAFVELTPEVTGLIHISALSDDYVRRVTDVVRTGDKVTVEVMNIDERGRYKLRRIVPESERKEPQAEDEAREDAPVTQAAEQESDMQPEAQPAVEPQEPEQPEPERDEPEPAQERQAHEVERQPEPDEFEDRW
jgi:predicted RNA-binding protein with RPS1 domain